MFNSIQQVHKGFFALFTPSIQLEGLEVPVIYPRHSNKTFVDKKDEDYPRIILLDKNIAPGRDWFSNHQETLLGYEDTTNNGIFDSVEVTKEPIQLEITYQMSGFFESVVDKWKFQDWFFGEFDPSGGIHLNKEVVSQFLNDEEFVSDSVSYRMSTNEIDRTDGIFEVTAEFILKPFVFLKKSELLPFITEFNLNHTPKK